MTGTENQRLSKHDFLDLFDYDSMLSDMLLAIRVDYKLVDSHELRIFLMLLYFKEEPSANDAPSGW